MLLREFIYFDRNHIDPIEDNRYMSQNDSNVLRKSDVRKTRLTLKMINEIRRTSEAHEIERLKELDLVKKMYSLNSMQPQQPM